MTIGNATPSGEAMTPIPETLADVPRLRAQAAPTDVALFCLGRSTTYHELDERSSRVANGVLAAAGGSDARLAYLGKNSDSYFEILFGGAKARVATVAVNWRLAPPEVEYVLADSGSRMLFVDQEFAPMVESMRDRLTTLKRVVVLGPGGAGGDYAAWRDAQRIEDPRLGVEPADAVLQMYSSGTTGRPKGVEIPQKAFAPLRRAERELGPWATVGAGDSSLVAMPTFHMLGTGLALTALFGGARCVILPAADAGETLRLISVERVTHLIVAPAFLSLLLDHRGCAETDFSSLRVITYAGSPVAPSLLERAQAAFRCDFVQYYGATETTGQVTCLAPEDHRGARPQRLRSCGRPIQGVELRIMGSDGRQLPPGEVGEIQVRAPSLMNGYWNLPDATAQAIVQGWYRTADVGFRDEEGYVTIVDRLKDMIVSGGENVYSAEVEAVISTDSAVAEVAVIGVPDPKWGEAVKAIVVPKQGAERDALAILERLRGRLAGYKIPKSIDFVDALLRNPSGKILKRELRAPYWKGHDRSVA
jgi:acyl-CoA synthetase (AMP-forming)/AMP-acid ligase II